MNRLEQEAVVSSLGSKVRQIFDRLLLAEGKAVPLEEIVSNRTGPESTLNEKTLRSSVQSQINRFAPRVDPLGFCVVKVVDNSIPIGRKEPAPLKSLAFALTIREELQQLGFSTAVEIKPGYFVDEVEHNRFIELLDTEHRLVPMIVTPKKERVKKKEAGVVKLISVEDIKDKDTRNFVAKLTEPGSSLAKHYGQPILNLNGDWPRLNRNSVATIILDALSPIRNSAVIAKIEEVLKSGVVYAVTEGENGAKYVNKQGDNFTLIQTIASCLYYREYRNLDDNKTSMGNKTKGIRHRNATKMAVAKIGANHILADVLYTKLKESEDNDEEDYS